jgi:hypothetical protein
VTFPSTAVAGPTDRRSHHIPFTRIDDPEDDVELATV